MTGTVALRFERDWFSKPGDTVVSLMGRKGLSATEVGEGLDGGLRTLRGLLAGDVTIDGAMAEQLAATVGGSSSFWLRRQDQYEEALRHVVDAVLEEDHENWLRAVPVPGPAARGRMSDDRRRAAVQKRLVFFDVNGPEAWTRRYGAMRSETQFRTSPILAGHDGATAMWLRQGELEAALAPAGSWNPDGLRSALGYILRLSLLRRPTDFFPKLREVLAGFGVALVGIKAPDGCRASGATRMLRPDKAMLLVSFRHRSDDHFWFTLAHEIGHLVLHGERTFVDDEDTTDDEFELEANAFAAESIVPPGRRSEFDALAEARDAVLRFAVSLGVAPGLLVGQLQHQGRIGRDKLTYLRRRWSWDQIEPVLAQPL